MSIARVAIIQNKIIKGGRFHVIAGIVKVLNEKGIVPDIITLKSKVKKEDTEQLYGEKINFNLKEILFDTKIPADFHILFFNVFVRYYLRGYSLIINSSNSSFLLPKKLNLLSYVHYPRKDRLLSNKVSIHFPEGENKNWFKFSHSYHNVAALFYRLNNDVGSNQEIIANSKFTKDAILRNYPIRSEEIKIIYPPVWKELNEKDFKPKNYKMICSLGRFAEDKRQIEQIHIAEKLPDYQFHIMGFAKEGDTYFKECKHLIEKKNLNNIFLYPTVDYSQMNQIFEESGFFIHSIRNEPFGIVTVEAISKRCIPIVHDSGGQKEIVSVDKLRYRDINEAVSLFKELAILDVTVFHKWIQQLTQNVREFNFANFREKFNRIFETKFKVGEIDQ